MKMLEWTYSGVNLSIEGTGGSKCIQYLSFTQILIETIVISILAVSYCIWSWPRLRLPYNLRYKASHGNARRLLLLLHGVTFGIELGFKFATNSLIWVLNPCHMVTVLQLVILAVPCTPLTTALFRLHVHMINGPLIALLFPVVNTRLLQFEQFVYYLQHIMILVVPMYLMKSEGVFSVEPLVDMSYAVMSLGLQTLYHFWVLQYVSYTTLINLDNIFCPAISDPFQGMHYRKWAVLHQSTLILIHGKIITLLSDLLIFRSYSIEKTTEDSDSVDSNESLVKNSNANEKFKTGNADCVVAVLTPDEAYSHNDKEVCIKDRHVWDLFLDQSDTISTRSFTISTSLPNFDDPLKKMM